jgi:ribosome-associated protein
LRQAAGGARGASILSGDGHTAEVTRSRTGSEGTACEDHTVQEIEIRGDMIRLGQLLKLADIADSGADARQLLLENAVTVNGDVETRRGRQLHTGDVVTVGEQAVRVA